VTFIRPTRDNRFLCYHEFGDPFKLYKAARRQTGALQRQSCLHLMFSVIGLWSGFCPQTPEMDSIDLQNMQGQLKDWPNALWSSDRICLAISSQAHMTL